MTLRGIYDYVIKSITTKLKSEQSDGKIFVHNDDHDHDTPVMTQTSLYSPTPMLPRLPNIQPSPPIHNIRSGGSDEKATPTRPFRSKSVSIPHMDPQNISATAAAAVTYRERLGGYLHPRDMRRLVTPFSSSNEPELIIRRHVMLLNFDPLRSIVLRDRMLLLVPDGADSILIDLERNVRGGINEMEKQVFGDDDDDDDDDDDNDNDNDNDEYGGYEQGRILSSSTGNKLSSRQNNGERNTQQNGVTILNATEVVDDLATAMHEVVEGINQLEKETFGCNSAEKHNSSNHKGNANGNSDDEDLSLESKDKQHDETSTTTQYFGFDNEWDDLEGMDWIEMPFELQCVDAVLSSVIKMLVDDSSNLRVRILSVMEQLRGSESGSAAPGDHTQEKLRLLKDEVKEMESRLQGFLRALNQTLDEDEDMALMNLSRLVAHPERFIQPVSQEILNEESDEPELILEAHLQQALCEVNGLELLKGQILNTEELVSLQMDTIRNRLLFINTVVSLISLIVAMASLIGSLFGMNLINHLEYDESAFGKVVLGTIVGIICLVVIFVFLIYRIGLMPRNPRKT